MEEIILDTYGIKIRAPRETLMLIPYFYTMFMSQNINDINQPILIHCDPKGIYSILDYVKYPNKPFPTKWKYLFNHLGIYDNGGTIEEINIPSRINVSPRINKLMSNLKIGADDNILIVILTSTIKHINKYKFRKNQDYEYYINISDCIKCYAFNPDSNFLFLHLNDDIVDTLDHIYRHDASGHIYKIDKRGCISRPNKQNIDFKLCGIHETCLMCSKCSTTSLLHGSPQGSIILPLDNHFIVYDQQTGIHNIIYCDKCAEIIPGYNVGACKKYLEQLHELNRRSRFEVRFFLEEYRSLWCFILKNFYHDLEVLDEIDKRKFLTALHDLGEILIEVY
jgi:hypothetical protein